MTEQFSLQVTRALNDLGFDEDSRRYRTDTYGEQNFVNSLCSHRLLSQFMLSGSKVEGTSKFTESDFDMVSVFSDVKATEYDVIVPSDNDLTLFMEEDTAPPGYCKLQLLQTGCNNFWHKHFLKHNCYIRCYGYRRPHLRSTAVVDTNELYQPFKCKKSGPSNQGQLPGQLDRDNVQAIRCAHMPQSFRKWSRRHRNHGWPTKQLMEEIAWSDIFVVPVGMHGTEQRDFHWRLSFNIQEKILIQNFSAVQYKIYVILKMIKTEIIQPQCPESITSYIIKTLMLWAVEQIPEQLWTERKLIDLLFKVLEMLYKCIQCVYCPMYFIPECNILHGRVTKTTREIINNILSLCLQDKISCILRLPSILTKLYQYVFVPMAFRDPKECVPEKTNIAMDTVRKVYCRSLQITEELVPNFLERQVSPPYEDLLKDLLIVPTPARSEEKNSVKYIFTEILCQLAMQQCDEAYFENISNISKYRRVRKCVNILQGNYSSNVMCGRVRLAQALCMMGQYEVAKNQMMNGADRLRDYMQKYSFRALIQKGIIDNLRFYKTCENGCLSTSQILRKFLLGSIFYGHRMELCLPKALQYEVHRSYYETRNILAFDPEILLFYSQYLCYEELGQKSHANVAFTNLIWHATRCESNIEYREIALNIVGHCFMRKGQYDKALKVLVKSVQLVHQYKHLHRCVLEAMGLNSQVSMWHIAVLLNKVCKNT